MHDIDQEEQIQQTNVIGKLWRSQVRGVSDGVTADPINRGFMQKLHPCWLATMDTCRVRDQRELKCTREASIT